MVLYSAPSRGSYRPSTLIGYAVAPGRPFVPALVWYPSCIRRGHRRIARSRVSPGMPRGSLRMIRRHTLPASRHRTRYPTYHAHLRTLAGGSF